MDSEIIFWSLIIYNIKSKLELSKIVYTLEGTFKLIYLGKSTKFPIKATLAAFPAANTNEKLYYIT